MASSNCPEKFRQELGSLASSALVAFSAALIKGMQGCHVHPESSTLLRIHQSYNGYNAYNDYNVPFLIVPIVGIVMCH
jgi:hypothetical protein